MALILNLYSKTENNFTHNGLKVLSPLKAIVKEEINGDYSLEITMPKGSSEIQNEQIIKVPTPKSSQLFRVYNSDIDMLGKPVYYARHIFYDLLDYFIEDTRPTGNGAFAISKILENTPFSGNSDITKQETAYYMMISPVKAILGADNAFIKVWGGELERDNFTVRMKNHLGENRGVSIRYRKNLKGLRLQTDLSGVATKIMPTGLQEDGQTILKLPEIYVSSPLIDNYANIKTTRIHYSDIKIDEETTRSQALDQLRNAARAEFQKGIDKPLITATVEFIPLQDTEEYKDLEVLERVYLGDIVNIFHEDLNISLEAEVISYEFDALSERYIKVVLGNTDPKYGDTQKNYVEKQVKESKTFLEQAISKATQLITGNSGGYVVLHPAEKPQEIFIMDTPDMNTAEKVWRWNLSGLGYSSTGINGPFSLAMTMDGEIVADFIKSGTINGALIQAGSVAAESLSQEYKNSVTNAITGVENSVTQAFRAADGQLSSTIQNEITRAQGIESTLSSSISQNAQNISLKVSKGDISSEISAESGNITISSNRISISSTNFTLNRNGTITCQNANVSGTIKAGGTYGYVELSYGRLLGGLNSSTESGYISFNHRYSGNPAPRIAGKNGICFSTPYLAVGDYADTDTSITVFSGQTASQTFVTKIENNSDGGITWYTKTITFRKGLMTTNLS